MTPTEIFLWLHRRVSFDFVARPFWWEGYGSFWVVVGAILTQNAKWSGVERALANLRGAGVGSLDDVAAMPPERLATLIKPSGFYNTKARRLGALARAICDDFGGFRAFAQNVSRDWLLAQKGLGRESADAILCYACGRAVMVVDAYTNRLLRRFGFEFECYDEAAEWLAGFEREAVCAVVGQRSEEELFAMFHGLFVEYGKAAGKGDNFGENVGDFADDFME